MSAPVLTSITPSSAAPGAAVTLAGTGFADGAVALVAGARVDAEFTSATELGITVPLDFIGPAGSTLAVDVSVVNPDGGTSGTLALTIEFTFGELQTYTTIAAVAGEIPVFKRGGLIPDSQIEIWMRTAAQAIAAAMLRRGLSLSAAEWTVASAATAMAQAAGILERINRLGAAAMLAAAIASNFGGGAWAPATLLRDGYRDEMAALNRGDYDRIFSPAAATIATGPQVAVGDQTDADGESTTAFTKTQVF